MKALIQILFLILLFSCDENQMVNHNVDKVEVFGDSLRVETEINGNTTIKHYLDLKGTADDGFDNSFNVTITIREEVEIAPLDCIQKYTFEYNNFYVSLCKDQIKKITLEESFRKENIDSLYIDSPIEIHPQSVYNSYLLSFIWKLNYQIVQKETNDTITRMLKGDFMTEFSGGDVYQVITSEKDTIDFLELTRLWM